MNRRLCSVIVHVMMVIFFVLPASVASSQTAGGNFLPGEDLGNGSGTLAVGEMYQTTLVGPTPVNIRLEVSGGAAADALAIQVNNSEGTESWMVRSGEVAWVRTNLPSGNTNVSLSNNSNAPLTFQFNAYARGTVNDIAEGESVWNGIAQGEGLQSSIQLNITTAGLYRFTLEATSGSYQIVVDSNYIRKTVVTGSTPDPADSVYYLTAGAHTFTIEQDPDEALTEWTVDLALLGGVDTLTSTERSAKLGGGSFFNTERIPLQIEADQPVNVRIATKGAASDSLVVELYNGADKVFTSIPVFGGEVAWGSSELTAGANSLRVVANGGNGAALEYSVNVSSIAQPSFTWNGKSYGVNEDNSAIRLTFPEGKLYTFTFGAKSGGRYQFQLGNEYFKKIITDAGESFTAYVPEGTFALKIDQDSQVASTEWSVAIAPTETSQIVDSLPFQRKGRTLGGQTNDFRDEWMPLQASGNEIVNLRVAVNGNTSDSLRVELYNTDTQTYSATTVYGGEVFWATSNVQAGRNRIHIAANAGNAQAMSYQVDVQRVEEIPNTWQGVSQGNGLHSTIHVRVPTDGIYTVALTMTEGLGLIRVDDVAPATRGTELRAVNTTQRWPLSAGLHTFTFEQDPGQPRTTWQIATEVRRSSDLSLYIPIIQR